MTVLVWGVPTEPPVAMVVAALADIGADVMVVSPRGYAHTEVCAGVGGGSGGPVLAGRLAVDGRRVALAGLRGAYLRPVEPELLPELRGRAAEDPARGHARSVHDALVGFTEVAGVLTGARIANPLSAMASNVSKPYQAQAVLRRGFSTPATLVTDDPQEVREFAQQHKEVVYKSVSGVRSVVTELDLTADRDRLELLRWCPVQFQERVRGPDVRVHVVGERVYAAAVDSEAVDYRYARAQVGCDARLHEFRLDAEVVARCVGLAADLGLPFAGIDLKLSPDGRVVCFEVNPSPGFSWYENETGLPIAAAVARWLWVGP